MTSAPSASWTRPPSSRFPKGSPNPSRSKSGVPTRKTISGSSRWRMLRRGRRLRETGPQRLGPEDSDTDRGPRQNDKSRDARAPKQRGKPHGENGSGFGREAGFAKKKRFQGKPPHAGQPQVPHASPAKPAFGKKAKKNRGG